MCKSIRCSKTHSDHGETQSIASRPIPSTEVKRKKKTGNPREEFQLCHASQPSPCSKPPQQQHFPCLSFLPFPSSLRPVNQITSFKSRHILTTHTHARSAAGI